MKPVLVLQHLLGDGPSYLQTWLRNEGLPHEVRCTEAGEAFPQHVDGYHALAILGGAMSANDDMPSLRQAEHLVREAVSLGVPVIGHCLGGQLMARALGGTVGPSVAPEIGWSTIELSADTAAADWFGPERAAAGRCTVFEWHYEAFSLPPGAVALAGNAACTHQAFAIGPHLAMQFHVELDIAKLQRWCETAEPSYHAAMARHPGSVQGVDQMLQRAQADLPAQQALAARIYRQWLSQTPRTGA